ncbi:MAG: PD-(D/E)XK nuclease family protein, partial [Zoogloeaceae bacterium]|nr:PD-(D/E)XK nuclease family protein [Zoogloeaceae bacterium]
QEKGALAALAALTRQYALDVRLLSQADGERRQTNVRHLFELLHQASRVARDPERLARWYADRIADPSVDEASLLRLESERDLVKIVTIHRAKGLEFDVVFCPFLWWEGIRTRTDKLPGWSYHEDDGELVIDYRPDHQETGKNRCLLEQAAESLRLFYVALTRPVHRCYLVWGAYKSRNSDLESRKSLLNWLVAGQKHAPQAWLTGGGDTLPAATEIAAAWRNLAQDADIGSEEMPAPVCHVHGATDETRMPQRAQYVAQQAKRPLFPVWRMDSFSGLLRGARWSDEARDPEDDVSAGMAEAKGDHPPLAADDPLLFPRGACAGDCIHALFERIEFTDATSFAPAAAAVLQRHPQISDIAPERLAAMLVRLASDVLSVSLPLPGGGVCLRQLPRQRRLAEFAFHLPVEKLSPARLQNLMAAYGEPLPRLTAETLSGYLKGYIDLVFMHAGRYYVLDWKSNHLGFRPEDYAAPALQKAMLAHAYTLQARFYLLALHRYLKFRLPDYDPARQLGGACCLFIRAMKPEWQAHEAPGIVFMAPEWERLQAMDRLLTAR